MKEIVVVFFFLLQVYISLAQERNNVSCKICNETGNYFSVDSCNTCGGRAKLSESCKTCKATGMIYCSVCTGAGVIKQYNNFGDFYFSCQKCHGKGFVQCQTCGGRKKHDFFCESCRGRGFIKSSKACDHK